MPAKDELMDILSLSRNLNSEINAFNQVTNDDSRTLKAKLVDPRLAAGELAAKAQQEAAASAQPQQASLSQYQMVQTLDGYSVPAPMSLIPLPAGVRMPEPEPPPRPASTPPPIPAHLTQAARVAPTVGQLELGLDMAARKDYANQLDYFEEKYNRLEQKFDIINAKLTELISRTKKNERKPREEKLARRLGQPSQTIPV